MSNKEEVKRFISYCGEKIAELDAIISTTTDEWILTALKADREQYDKRGYDAVLELAQLEEEPPHPALLDDSGVPF